MAEIDKMVSLTGASSNAGTSWSPHFLPPFSSSQHRISWRCGVWAC